MTGMIEEEIFAQAIELTRDERSAFLLEKCGDDSAFRSRIERLLVAHDSDSRVLDVTDDGIGNLSAILKEEVEALNEVDSVELGISSGDGVKYFGDYIIREEVARGAMGIVYRAEQTSLKRTVALKMIRSSVLFNDEDVRRFQRESESAASLNHPNIIPIYEVGHHEGRHYFTMKLIEGGTLVDTKEILRKTPKAAVRLIIKVARAVHFAHQHGILHRDIKPSNILINDQGEPVVIDFGLAKQLESDAGMTISGQIIGTPYYMAPEQAQAGKKDVTTAADIYSLGAMLYELLTGEKTHQGDSLIDTLQLVVNEEPKAPRILDPSIDRDLEIIVLKCLERDPMRRYSSAEEMARDLERWLSGEAVIARPVGIVERGVKWVRRKPALASLWAVGFLLLLTLGIGGPLLALRMSKLRNVAETSANLETEARILAQEQAEENRRQLYYADMNLVSHIIAEQGNFRNLDELILKWIPTGDEEDLRGWEWYYLNAALYQEWRSFDDSGINVSTAAWNPDRTRIASANDKGELRIWNVVSNEKPVLLEGDNLKVNSIDWNPDGDRLVAGVDDGTVRVWDTASGEAVLKLPIHMGAVEVAWSNDGSRIASGGENKVVHIINAEDGAMLHSIPVRGKRVWALAWSPDDHRLVSAGNGDKALQVWNTDTGESVWNLARDKWHVYAVSWSPDGRMLASESESNSIAVRDTTSWKKQLSLPGHAMRILDLGWSPDSRRLASSGWDSTVRIWDIAAKKQLSVMASHLRVHSISWTSDSQRLTCTSGESEAVFEANREQANTLKGPGSLVRSLQWNQAGDRLLSVSYNNIIRIWNADDDRQAQVFAEHNSILMGAEWSPDNSRVAAAAEDGTVSIWDAETGEKIRKWKGHQGKVRLVRWSPSDERLASLGEDGMVKVWDSVSGRELASWEEVGIKDNYRYSLAWHPDGKWLATPGQSGSVQIRDTKNFELIRQLNCIKGSIMNLKWSPNGDRLALLISTGMIQILPVDGKNKAIELSGLNSIVKCFDWSPDGKRLAAGSRDRTVRIWETKTGRQCIAFKAHEREIQNIIWSPDGNRLATASIDKTIKIWSNGKGKLPTDSQ